MEWVAHEVRRARCRITGATCSAPGRAGGILAFLIPPGFIKDAPRASAVVRREKAFAVCTHRKNGRFVPGAWLNCWWPSRSRISHLNFRNDFGLSPIRNQFQSPIPKLRQLSNGVVPRWWCVMVGCRCLEILTQTQSDMAGNWGPGAADRNIAQKSSYYTEN